MGSVTLASWLSQLEIGEGDVQASLSSVLGRADLTIAYWMPDAERWVDRAGGRVVVDEAEPGITVISRRGERVAALRGGTPLPELDASLAAVVGLVLENERLQLALHARLDEQEALRRIATVVARQHGPEEVLALVTREVAHHLAADAAMTALASPRSSRTGAHRA
jgi:hypothetical protein